MAIKHKTAQNLSKNVHLCIYQNYHENLHQPYMSDMDIAIENTAKILLEKLKEYINEDYYNLYEPIYYKPRTMKFLKSAVANITGKSTATIGIDKLYRSYQYPFGDWTGEEQTYMADAGFHGNSDIYRDGMSLANFCAVFGSISACIFNLSICPWSVPISELILPFDFASSSFA